MRFCSISGCKESITDTQADTTTKLFGKAYCLNHEKTAREEAEKASGAFTIDTTPYTKCGFKIENGLAVKIIGQVEVTVDIAKMAAGKSKKDCMQMGGYPYEFGQNPEVDGELKWLCEMVVPKKKGTDEKTKRMPAPAADKTGTPTPAKKETADVKTEVVVAPSSHNAIVRPAVSPAEAIAAWREFNELKAAIVSDADRQKIGDKSFVKKSGWRKLAAFFNLTDKIIEEVQTPHPDGGWTWKIKVVAIATNGRMTEGVGICSTAERKFAHVEHDTYATAHTRAKNRAISDMIAGGEVSAEEVE